MQGIYLIVACRLAGGELSVSRKAAPEVREHDAQLLVRRYIHSFNRKIWLISLTILFSILGLIPFLFDGPKEVFWFAFAVSVPSPACFSPSSPCCSTSRCSVAPSREGDLEHGKRCFLCEKSELIDLGLGNESPFKVK